MPRKRQENVKSSVKNRKCRRYKVSFKRQLHCLSRRVCRQWGQYPCTCCGCAANSPFVQVCVLRTLARTQNTHLYYNLWSPAATHLNGGIISTVSGDKASLRKSLIT